MSQKLTVSIPRMSLEYERYPGHHGTMETEENGGVFSLSFGNTDDSQYGYVFEISGLTEDQKRLLAAIAKGINDLNCQIGPSRGRENSVTVSVPESN